jgi:Fe-S-cluster containining protein
MSEEFLCARCARHTRTCCQDTQIYVTPGDVERIAARTGRRDFYEFRLPDDPIYLDNADDPLWALHVFREDGTRRILKHEPNGDCTFLGEQGCTLPIEARPLICRLYPFDYNAEGIKPVLARGCPLELLLPGQLLLEEIAMDSGEAAKWHEQLYEEILAETPQMCPSP